MPNAALGMNAGALGVLNVGVGVDLRSFNSGMDQVEQRAGRATQTINQMGSSLGTGAAMGAGFAVATAALTALTSAASGAVGAVVGLSSQLEQAQIGFTAFTGSAQKAGDFIKQLQDFAAHTTFEFPGLLQASRQLMGMGVQAELVIPIMKDVGAAVMAVGGGDTEIKRVNLAITQMMAAGKVNAQDMNQLAQAGIPAWKMLADSMGVSIGRVRELSKQGQISAAQMLQAFHSFVQNNNLDDMLVNANKTWQAATSNMIDGLRNMATEGFSPFFAMARDGLVAIADELTSIDAKNFAQDMKATAQDIVNSLAPVREAISNAFSAFKTDGVSAALQSLLQSAQQMAVNMFGAGITVVEEFASGIVSGASNAITAAANFVADIIASYLIGSSPPPVGPLSQIATGGAAVIEAYVEGMKGGLGGLEDLAQNIVDTLGRVNGDMTFAEGRAALQSAGSDMHALQSALDGVDGVLRGIDDQMRENATTVKDYQNAITDIKDAYEGAIAPLQQQVDALKEANDLTQKQSDLQDRIALARLKGQLAQAQGDPGKRAQLQTQLDELESQEKQIALQETGLRLQQQQQDLADKAAGRKADPKDNTATQQQINALAQRKLAIDQQQNAIQIQLTGMVDKEAVARIKSQQAQVQAAKDQRDINNEVADLNRQLQAAPLEQQIKDLKAQEQALIEPIETRLRQHQREGEALQAQRQQWQGLKGDITDVMQEQRRLAAEQKKAAEEAKKASKEAALDNPLDLAAIFKPEEIKAQATKIGQSWLTGFKDYLTTNAGAIIGGAIGAVAGGSMFGPLGAVAGAAFGAQFTTRLLGSVGGLENLGGLIAGKISDALNIDTGGASNSIEAFGIIFVTLKDRALEALETLRTGIVTKLQDAQSVLSGWQKTWQQTFGSETPGAQAGVNAIEGLNKALQALQLLMQGDFKAAFETAKESFATFGKAGEDTVAAVNKFVTDVQAKLQPFIDGIKKEWLTVVEAWNSAKFQDNISIVAANASTALGLMRDIVDKLYISIAPLIDLIKQGAGPTLTWGAAMQDAAAKAAAWTTTLVNLLDAENVYLATLGRIKNELVLTGQAVVEFARLIADTFIHPGDFGIAQGHLDIISGLTTSLNKEGETIQKDWADLIARIKARQADLAKAGQEASAGIAQGVTAGQPQVDAAITKTADDLHSKFAERMQSRSPSQVMLAEGVNVNTGLTQGITDSTTLVIDAITVEADLMLQTYTLGFTALLDLEAAQLAVMLELLVASGQQKVQAVNEEMTAMLDASTAGFSAIHAGATQQLDEIYALLVAKGTDMTGAVTNTMAAMLTVIMGEQEKWSSAGTALGTAFAQSATTAMSNISVGMPSGSGGMSMLSNNGPLTKVDTSSSQAALKSWVGALMDAQQRTGIPARTLWGLIMAENGGGQSSLSRDSNNYFSISAVPGRKYQSGVAPGGRFASYATPQDSLNDFLSLITESQSYAGANANKGDVDRFIKALVDAHYIVPEAGFPVETWIRNVKSGAASFDQMLPPEALQTMSMPTAGKFRQMGGLGTTQITAGAQAGLSVDAAMAACGPYAATLFMQAVGRPPNLAEATRLAAQVGWTAARGMGGTSNFMSLLSNMGLQAVQQAATPMNVNAATAAGNPLAISTPKHYFVAQGGTAEGGLNVGSTGTVMGGKPTMTLAEIQALGGGINDIVVLLGTLDKAGTQTFNNLTHVSGQMGPSVEADKVAQEALAQSTQSLATTISGGLVPSGLAARGVIGEMAIGVQPLISQFANGQITTDQLGQAIVTLASNTGLTTAPLAAMQAGTLSTNAAMRQVLDSLIAADPAFSAIQQSFDATAQTSGDLANVLLQGLSNVTGQVPASLTQLANAAKPLQEAFTAGAISGDDFVKGVVALAATSGLTQQPLRAMQDGLLTSNEALAAVVTQVAAADPAMASMSTSIAETQQPATDAATAFVTWAESMAQTQQATTDAQTAVERVPEAVEGIQKPVEEAATTSMQTIPDQANIALDSTVQAINAKSGDFSSAGEALGKALVDSISNVVKESAQRIADDVSAIVKDALEAAKKAADEATANLKSKTKGGGSSSKKDGDQTDSKATGGRLTPGIWTLVGEEGPELISPNGYVYTAAQTLGMVADGMASGLISLERFASGGKSSTKSKSSSKSKKSKGTEAAAKKQQTEPYLEEVNLAQQVMGIEQQRDKLLVEMLPLQEKIRKEQQALEAAEKGSLATQLQLNTNKKVTAEIESQIYHLTYDERPMYTSMYKIQQALNEAKRRQEEAGKGDLFTQIRLNAIETEKLINNQQIARIQLDSLPVRQHVADLEAQIADIQKGSLADQLRSAAINAEKNKNLLAENAIQIQAAPLRAQAAAHEREIQRILDGTLGQRQTIAQNELKIAQITQTELQTQRAMLPVQSALRDVQKEIDRITNGTVDVQKQAVDLSVKQAQLRLQEIDAQGQLRDVEAGTLNLNQQQINDLHKRLEIISAQKDDLSDQSETQSLIATVASADARKRLIDLNAQASVQQDVLDTNGDQKAILQNQNDLIKTGNQVSAAGEQAKLADLQEQLSVYDEQIAGIEAQNSVLDLQLQGIQLQNQIRADGLAAELLTLQNQLSVYDAQIAKVQQQNDVLTAQAAVITSNNAVAAAGYNSQIILMQSILSARQLEIDRLNEQKNLIAAQTSEINNQNTIAASGHQAQIIQLGSQLTTQENILADLNAQIGALNAQKKIYQDIRDLADAIANRPVSARPAPGGTTGGSGGPPGAVAATASKEGAETLYLSRGTGTDGWYTSAGQLVVQGGSSNPPSGYKVKWLSEGGILRKGEIAIVGEDGPEPIIAQRDLVVFPNESLGGGSGRSGRPFSSFAGIDDSDTNSRNITVNVEYHRHGGTDYGEGTLTQIVREAIDVALRQ